MSGPSAIHLWCWAHALLVALVLAFLLPPVAAIVPLSFSSGSLLLCPIPGWSLRWCAEVCSSPQWMRGLTNSMLIGVGAKALAVVLAALGLPRQRGTQVTALKALMISPMIVPVILIAVGSYFFLTPLGLTAPSPT